MVKLPIKDKVINKIGDSREIAFKRLHSLEGRFKRDSELKKQYVRFMNVARLVTCDKLIR